MLALLVLSVAACVAAESFTYKHTTGWLDSRNWVNGSLPGAGSVVVFPESFSKFNLESCTGGSAVQCAQGGVISIRPSEGHTVAEIELAKLELPENGKIIFDGDVFISLDEGGLFSPAAPNNVSWLDRGPQQFDFNCADNWVITGTSENPLFQIPCFNDTAVFPDGSTYMSYVPSNTFVAHVSPSGPNAFSDNHEFSGSTVNVASTSCPEPFFSSTGVAYCSDICVNSCPGLNPDSVAGIKEQISQNQAVSKYVGIALSDVVSSSGGTVSVSSSKSFAVPSAATASDIEIVRQKVVSELPKHSGFPLSISCAAGSSPIACNFTGTVGSAVVSAYSSSSVAPYVFTDGLLSMLFDGLVSLWFQQQQQQQQQTSNVGSDIDALIASLDRFGADTGLVATGVYSFSDLDINQHSQSLTNALCSRFIASNMTQSQFHQRVATEMAKVLPVPASGISFTSALECGPYYPFQTRPDQRSTFAVQGMSIKTLYTRFGSNANYVTYSSGSGDHSAQPFEINAPLSADNVKAAMNTALRIVVLGVLQQSLNNETMSYMALVPQGSTGTASLPIIPIIAAAAGAMVVLIVIVVVVRRQRRGAQQQPSKEGRGVVAFENPMYDTAKHRGFSHVQAAEGLYDEPAFISKADKSNPVFSSHENLASSDDFGQVIGVLNDQHQLYNEPAGFSLSNGSNVYGDEEGPADAHGYLDVAPIGEQDQEQAIYDNKDDGYGFETVASAPTVDQPIYDNNEDTDEVAPQRTVAASEPEQLYEDLEQDDVETQPHQEVREHEFLYDAVIDEERAGALPAFDVAAQFDLNNNNDSNNDNYLQQDPGDGGYIYDSEPSIGHSNVPVAQPEMQEMYDSVPD